VPQTPTDKVFGPVEEVRSAPRTTRGLCVARTIADLIDTPHIAEALQYRKREGELNTRAMESAESPGLQRDRCDVHGIP